VRLMLERSEDWWPDGYVLVRCEAAVFKPED
jgi:hypothetical protein